MTRVTTTMPTRTLCPHCKMVLTIPAEGIGRRLKCPDCGGKFQAGTAESRPPSKAAGVAEAQTSSSIYLPSPQEPSDVELPTAPGSLRETFDLDIPLLQDDEPAPRGQGRMVSDAAALFHESPAPARRRLAGAEARAQARRCVDCGGYVAAGMSLCQSCGLDQESGQRIDLAESLIPDEPPSRRELPVGVLLVGVVALLASGGLSVLALIRGLGATDSMQGMGALLLALVCVVGVFAAIQLLLGRSYRLLLVALALGAMVDVAALIVLPVWQASQVMPDAEVAPLIVDADPNTVAVESEPAPDPDEVIQQSYEERLNWSSLMLGLAVLLLEAAIFTYLMSPGVRSHYERS